MFGDHAWLVLVRAIIFLLSFICFLLFFIGLGTEKWFVVANGALTFDMSPLYFCALNRDCVSIDWSTFPTPPCGITTTTLGDRYRATTGFTVLAGLCTIVIMIICSLTFCTARKPKYIEIIFITTLASACFGYISATIWAYTVENYQYCGLTYCSHMLERNLAASGCTESLGDSWNAIIAASSLMLACTILAGVHMWITPQLDLEDPDAVVSQIVPSKVLAVFERNRSMGAGSPNGRVTTRALQPYDFENEDFSQRRKRGENTNTSRRAGSSPQQQNKKRHHHYTHQSHQPQLMSGAPRNMNSSLRKSHNVHQQYHGDPQDQELDDESSYYYDRTAAATNNNNYQQQSLYSSRGLSSTTQKKNKKDVWRPPKNSDYQIEPQTGLWWSSTKPNEYIDGKTGHILDTEQNLWYDPGQGVWYEVEEEQ